MAKFESWDRDQWKSSNNRCCWVAQLVESAALLMRRLWVRAPPQQPLFGLLMKNGPYELIIAPVGYPGKRYRGRYAYEHRVNWWRDNGRNPDDVGLIHHKDDAKRNNTPTNLMPMTRSSHSAHHAKPLTLYDLTCDHCRKHFKTRKKTQQFCSRRCIGLYGFPKRTPR